MSEGAAERALCIVVAAREARRQTQVLLPTLLIPLSPTVPHLYSPLKLSQSDRLRGGARHRHRQRGQEHSKRESLGAYHRGEGTVQMDSSRWFEFAGSCFRVPKGPAAGY